jgi:outer membrane immunogenic protein
MKTRSAQIFVAAFLSTLGALGAANAADLPMTPAPVYKAPPAATGYSWTGCYVGGGAGYGWWKQYSFVTGPGGPITAPMTNGGNGWVGQGQFGCDYQFSTPALFNLPIVVGAFGDYDGGSITGETDFPGVDGIEKESSAWSVGGRIGTLIAPRVLTYVDGGWTQARFDAVNFNIAIAGGGPSGISMLAQTYNGWFIGSGFEYALDWLPIHGLFLKTEYRYSQYDGASVPLIGAGVPPGTTLNSKPSTEMISTELVWRFNWQQ